MKAAAALRSFLSAFSAVGAAAALLSGCGTALTKEQLKSEYKKIVPALLAALSIAPVFAAEESLKLDKTAGAAPLTIAVVSPVEIPKRAAGWMRLHSPGGSGFSLNWGDGSDAFSVPLDPKKPPSQLYTHTYTKAGTYTVEAALYDPGPDDGPIWKWRGKTTVTVTSPDKKP